MFENLSLFYLRHNKEQPAREIHARTISYYDLTVLYEGELQYEINGKPVELHAGELLLIPPLSKRKRQAGKVVSEYVSFNFYADSEPEPLLKAALTPTLRAILSAIDELQKEPVTVREKPVSLLICALLSLLMEGKKHLEVGKITGDVLSYLENHYTEKITLKEIAAAAFFSPVYTETVFRREMGMPIIEYLLAFRIGEAKKLLREGNRSVSEVASAVGIPDANYFSRMFKLRTGETPLAYRRRKSELR